MYQVWIIDEEGFYTGESLIVRKLLPNYITTPVPSGLVKPKWVAGWVEGATEEELEDWRNQFLPPKDLTNEKAKLIADSKTKLAEWLFIHPMYSEVKHTAGAYYAVTQEKQALLTQNITLYELSQKTGIPFNVSWNSVGEECEIWDINELVQLSFEMTNYVLPRVKLQQKYETMISKATTEKELEDMSIDYSAVQIEI